MNKDAIRKAGKAVFVIACAIMLQFFYNSSLFAQTIALRTKYATVSLDNKGYITSIKDRSAGREYVPKGMSSALLSLCINKRYLLPQKAVFNKITQILTLKYSDKSLAHISVKEKEGYLRFQLLSLDKKSAIDNIVWGPYKTIISRTIGEIISVVRNDDFAIGMMALNDNTTSGPPTDGDMGFLYYYIHSPDPVKYPLPPHLKEGQTFKIGGDGISDIAFYSQPEEYYRMSYGDGARLEPAYGSSICMHSRDRRKEQMIYFPMLPDNLDGGFNSARHQLVLPVDAGFEGSSIALYACPDTLGLKTIESVVLSEGLPHITDEGKWIKDPAAYKPDIAWSGPHDSLYSYAAQLGIKGIQDEGWGEYYPDPANRWGKDEISFSGKQPLTVAAFGKDMRSRGIRFGLHTLCEFLQPDRNSDVAPVPNDSLSVMMRSSLTKDITSSDTVITISDTSYFNEFGGWEGNHTNVLKIGKELIEYNGITTTRPYTFLHLKRGLYGTGRGSYRKGTQIVKLQPNCYRGFAPDMALQEEYADYYGKLLTDGGMDYIDFDGLESCMYQGHGQYSFKRFFRKLFDSYQKNGGKYLRVMGSSVYEGNWHYMSVCNIGGGDHMFSPVLNKWGIEGKDMRYVFQSNYMAATFGIISYASDWSLYDAENLQAKSIGWDATYMLGLSQDAVEKSGEKESIFQSFRLWEDARRKGIFTKALKEKLKNLDYKYHLEQNGSDRYTLYSIRETRFEPLTISDAPVTLNAINEFQQQPLEFSVRIGTPDKMVVHGLRIGINDKQLPDIDERFENGEYIICKKGKLYLADKNRKIVKEISKTPQTIIDHGTYRITLQTLGNEKNSSRLTLVASVMNTGEPIL